MKMKMKLNFSITQLIFISGYRLEQLTQKLTFNIWTS